MKAIKYTLKIKIEVLSKDSFGSLLLRLEERLADECSSGQLVMDDGDNIDWDTTIKEVLF